MKGCVVAEHNPKYIEAQKRGKVDYSTVPWRVIGQLAQAMMEGAEKYGRFNYREDDIEARTYIAAICRHLFGDPSTGSVGWVNGEDIDVESGLPHLVKVMACCLLVEDARMHGKLIDNRLATESKTPPALCEQASDDFGVDVDVDVDVDYSGCAFDVVFTQLDAAGRRESETVRGPYQTLDAAMIAAHLNPEQLPGLVSIRNHSTQG